MKKIVPILTLLAVLTITLAAFCACDFSQDQTDGVAFTDAEGREVVIPYSPQRVVSLQGSFAETWLIAGGTLKGVTSDLQEDYGISSDGAQIIGTVKEPDSEIVVSLNPDFVILSADIAAHKNVASLLDSVKIPYAYFKQETFSDYLFMLDIFTRLTGNTDNYAAYGTSLQSSIQNTIALANSREDKPRVLFLRARSQGVSAKASDHMVCTILEEFGCVNIADITPSLLENLSIEQIIKEDPDVILVTFMGDENAAKLYLENNWENNPAWSGLTAVKNNRYVFLQKNLYHFKPNSRWAQAYETLYNILFE